MSNLLKTAGVVDMAVGAAKGVKEIAGGAGMMDGALGLAQNMGVRRDANGNIIKKDQRLANDLVRTKNHGRVGGLLGAVAGGIHGHVTGSGALAGAQRGASAGYLGGALVGAARKPKPSADDAHTKNGVLIPAAVAYHINNKKKQSKSEGERAYYERLHEKGKKGMKYVGIGTGALSLNPVVGLLSAPAGYLPGVMYGALTHKQKDGVVADTEEKIKTSNLLISG